MNPLHHGGGETPENQPRRAFLLPKHSQQHPDLRGESEGRGGVGDDARDERPGVCAVEPLIGEARQGGGVFCCWDV